MAKKATKNPKSSSSSSSITRKRRETAKFDVKKPKKPPTAFFYFLEDFRKEFQEQNPHVKSMRDIGKACGDKWKTITYELSHWLQSINNNQFNSRMDDFIQPEKVKYYDIATEKRAEFDRAMADYIKRQESGEAEETEDDSKYDG